MVKTTENISILGMLQQSIIQPINSSKLFAGLLMIIMNIGSKYVEVKLTKTQEQALRNALCRELIIFCVAFLGTRDIVLSILMTAAFVILSNYIFNEQSQFCIMPERLKKISNMADLNNDGVVSASEEKKALETLEKAKNMRKKQQQGEFLSYMNNYSNQGFID